MNRAGAFRRFALVWLLLCIPAREARADWFVTPWVGLKFGGSTNFTDWEQSIGEKKLVLGGSGGVLGSEFFGIEVDFGYAPRFFERTNDQVVRSNVTTLMGNIVIAVPLRLTRDSLRPYIVGGVGLMHVTIEEGTHRFDVDTNLLGLNVGGGAIGRLTNRASIRFELRRFSNLTEPGEPVLIIDNGRTLLSFWRAAVGVTLQY